MAEKPLKTWKMAKIRPVLLLTTFKVVRVKVVLFWPFSKILTVFGHFLIFWLTTKSKNGRKTVKILENGQNKTRFTLTTFKVVRVKVDLFF